jgi:hypothetical protein
MMGGFEWSDLDGHRNTIPTDLTDPDGTGVSSGICVNCVAAGCGDAAWQAFYEAQGPDLPSLSQILRNAFVNFFTERMEA